MNTIEAFSEMINQRGIHSTLKMKDASVRTLRRRMNKREPISYEKMMELLIKAGYHIETEMTWAKPATSNNKSI